MDPWLTHSLAVLVGVGIGSGFCWFMVAGRPKVREAKAVEVELKAYREKVAHHFAETATVVNELTDRYRTVFEQLQSGANDLLDETELRKMSGDPDQQAVTLHRLGWKPAAGESPDVEPTMDAVEDDEPKPGLQADAAENADETDEQQPAEKGEQPAKKGEQPAAEKENPDRDNKDRGSD